MKYSRRVGLACLVFALLLLPLGCGSGSSTPGKLSGRVTLDGSPVTGGLLYVNTDKGAIRAIINADGSYTATDLPVGEWKVTVSTDTLNPKLKEQGNKGKYAKKDAIGPMPNSAPKIEKTGEMYVAIPDRYTKKDTTPLSVNVTASSQTKNFELTK